MSSATSPSGVTSRTRLEGQAGLRARIGGVGGQRVAVGIALILMVAGAALGVEGFATTRNIRSILFAVSVTGILAVAMSLITIRGDLFSLSMGATVGFASIVFNKTLHLGVSGAVAVVVVVTGWLGISQGLFIGRLRANPILTTIAASSIIIGLGVRLSDGQAVRAAESSGFLSADPILDLFPPGFVAFALVTVSMDVLVRHTIWGRQVTLLGSSRAAGEASGIDFTIHSIVLYGLASAGAGLAGAVLAAQQRQGSVNIMVSGDFDAIAAVLVGGVVVTGGLGSPRNAAVGAVFLAVIDNILRLQGAEFYTQDIVKGLVIAAVIAGPPTARNWREWSRRRMHMAPAAGRPGGAGA